MLPLPWLPLVCLLSCFGASTSCGFSRYKWGFGRTTPSSRAVRGGADETALTSEQQQQPKMTLYDVSVCAHQGGRSYMEDEHFVSQTGDFCAVFDGHGGSAVSRYLRQNLYANLQASLPSVGTTTRRRDNDDTSADDAELSATTSTPSLQDYEQALIQGLDKVDREVQRISHWSYQGSTAVAVWLHEEKDGTARTVLAANVGDSRAVLSRAAVAIDLTRDHKPNDPIEKARVEAMGGKVVWCGLVDDRGLPVKDAGVYRINGNLALARAVGDRSERPPVIGEPEIGMQVLDEESDDFIVLGSDGLWDVMSSQQVVSFVHSKLGDILDTLSEDSLGGTAKEKMDRSKIASLVVEEALRRGTIDNVTVVIIWLDGLAGN